MRTANCIFLSIVMVLAACAVVVSEEGRPNSGYTDHTVYLPNTDHELHVYRIYGREPGKTVMILGGIHGNEPGGYLAADVYVDLKLRRGNLIVVPRANLNSILSNHRGKNGDYNRKFDTELQPNDNNDDRIISVLKELMEESDLLLNLHDGSGFYRDRWIDNLHNPYKYGQSIIADCERFKAAEDGHVIDLGELARRIVSTINGSIEADEFQFNFANHNSVSPDTKYPEMRKTATYYALTQHHIPAFGIETSKSLPTTEMKVSHQVLAINAFLDEFGVIAEVPPMRTETPRLEYVIVEINGSDQLVVRNGGQISVPTGAKIRVDHIVGNYERYLFADIVGEGGHNDNGLEVAVNKPLTIRVRKDSELCGEVKILPGATETDNASYSASRMAGFVIEVNEGTRFVAAGEELNVIRGDKLKIVDYVSPQGTRGINVNFHGFVGNPRDNHGEDRGYPIDTARDLLRSWSMDGNGERYSVAAKRGSKVVNSFVIHLMPSDIEYIVYRTGTGKPRLVNSSERISLPYGETLTILSVHTASDSLENFALAMLTQSGETNIASRTLTPDTSGSSLLIKRGRVTLASFEIELTGSAKDAERR